VSKDWKWNSFVTTAPTMLPVIQPAKDEHIASVSAALDLTKEIDYLYEVASIVAGGSKDLVGPDLPEKTLLLEHKTAHFDPPKGPAFVEAPAFVQIPSDKPKAQFSIKLKKNKTPYPPALEAFPPMLHWPACGACDTEAEILDHKTTAASEHQTSSIWGPPPLATLSTAKKHCYRIYELTTPSNRAQHLSWCKERRKQLRLKPPSLSKVDPLHGPWTKYQNTGVFLTGKLRHLDPWRTVYIQAEKEVADAVMSYLFQAIGQSGFKYDCTYYAAYLDALTYSERCNLVEVGSFHGVSKDEPAPLAVWLGVQSSLVICSDEILEHPEWLNVETL